MTTKRIEELQEKYCFKIIMQRGKKGIVPQLNTKNFITIAPIAEIKSAKWEIIDFLEKRDEARKFEKEDREKQEKENDLKKVEVLKKSGQLVYFMKFAGGECITKITLETGFFDEELAKQRNYKEEYQKNMLWGNSATERIKVSKIFGTDIKKTEETGTYNIGMYDTYVSITKKEWKRLLLLEQQRTQLEQQEKEKKLQKKKEQAEKEEKEFFEKAKETKKTQWKQIGIIDCQGGVEDCSFDSVSIAYYPDGTKKRVISHCH